MTAVAEGRHTAGEDEFSSAMAPILDAMARAEQASPTDWRARRAAIERGFVRLSGNLPENSGVRRHTHVLPSGLGLTEFRLPDAEPAATLVYAHGGGRYACTVETYERLLRAYASLGVRVLAVEYRRPPEDPLPRAVADLISASTWASDAFDGRIVLGGDSGGGGFVLSAALTMRDANLWPIDSVMAIYPMLDDRTAVAAEEIADRLLWTPADNRAAWTISTPEPIAVPHLVPARTEDLSGLPPLFMETGLVDLFANETIDFATRAARAGVAVTLRTIAHAPHAFELVAPSAADTRRSWAARKAFLCDAHRRQPSGRHTGVASA